MSSSKIRKAIGVVKDKTTIRLAKVAGNVAPDLEILIVKATGHDNEPAEEKYIREILHRVSQSRGYVSACVYNISKRLSKTHDWIVALKALTLVHRLLVDGNPVFSQEIMFASRKGARVLNMSDFRVEACSNHWDHLAFVKNYAMYLDQKLDFIAFSKSIQKSKSYGDLVDDSVACGGRKEIKAAKTVNEMKPDKVLERLGKLIRVMDRVLSCRPVGNARTSKMVVGALCLVLRESFRVYADVSEVLGVLLDRFSEMEYGDCVKTFDQYVTAAKRIDELVDFYSWSKELGVARAAEFPVVEKVTDKILGTLERFLREKKNKLEKNMENCCIENGSSSTTTTTLATMEDLLSMNDDSLPPVVNDGGSGKADWEVALVESASNLPTQQAPGGSGGGGGGGLDLVMLNGIYDQGAVTAQPVLALPAPNKKVVQPVVDPQDPFAASLTVPPPPYVQLADLAKKWQPYGNNGGGYYGMGQQAGYTYAHY